MSFFHTFGRGAKFFTFGSYVLSASSRRTS